MAEASPQEMSTLSASSSFRIASHPGTGCIISPISSFDFLLTLKIFLFIILLKVRMYTWLVNNWFSKLNERYSKLPLLEVWRLCFRSVRRDRWEGLIELIEYALSSDLRNWSSDFRSNLAWAFGVGLNKVSRPYRMAWVLFGSMD